MMLAIFLGSFMLWRDGNAQDIPTAKGPGSYVSVGGELSGFQADYGQRVLAGGVVFAELNPTWRFGIEGEARYLRIHTDEDVTETNYLAGPRVMLKPGPLRPYVKFLAGAGKIEFPFDYAEGTFFTCAPGAGADYLIDDRWTLRLVDFEYQMWPHFSSYGELRPYGISVGVSFRLNSVEHYPKNATRSRWK
ncbi:MAG: outer membrane beta-barrel protein [Acidobacteriaceae bacterium]